MKKPFSFKKLKNSFSNAFNGIKIAYRQQNFRLMIALAILTLFFGVILKLSYLEWLILILIIGLVLSLEILNTFFEELLDILEPNYSKKIKIIKDLSSAAVLMISLSAIILGILMFCWKILNFIKY